MPTKAVPIRFNETQLALIDKAANEDGLKRSAWMKQVLLQAAVVGRQAATGTEPRRYPPSPESNFERELDCVCSLTIDYSSDCSVHGHGPKPRRYPPRPAQYVQAKARPITAGLASRSAAQDHLPGCTCAMCQG